MEKGGGQEHCVFQYLKGHLLGEEVDLYHMAPMGKLQEKQTSVNIKETLLRIRAAQR